MIHEKEEVLENYKNVWDVHEGDRPVTNNTLMTVQTRRPKPITVSDHPVTIGDLEVNSVLIVKGKGVGDVVERKNWQ